MWTITNYEIGKKFGKTSYPKDDMPKKEQASMIQKVYGYIPCYSGKTRNQKFLE